HELQVRGSDRARREDMVFKPVEQSPPVRRTEKHDREVLDLSCLREGQRLEKLVQRAEAARKDDEPPGVFNEHVLADEEIAELDAEVDVTVQRLLVRQLDVATDGKTARLVAPAVDGLHDSRPAPG